MSPRPKRNRMLNEPPIVTGFIPRDGDYNKEDAVILHFEEYESIRLSDYDGLTQLEASKLLGVSRPTFTRIYDAARKKVAKAFVENKCISVEGGDVIFKQKWYYCNHCHSVFKVNNELSGKDKLCLVCDDSNITALQDSGNWPIHAMRNKNKNAKGLNMSGNCICPKCDLQIPHKAGVPCSSLLCPKCNIRMIRKNSEHHKTILNKRKYKIMKKLALPTIEGSLSHHFGHSKEFYFFEIEGNKIINKYTKEPPPHAEGTIPRWLAAENVTHLLVGGIGPKAIEILNAAKIDVYVNVVVDTADNIALNYINNELKFGQNYCSH